MGKIKAVIFDLDGTIIDSYVMGHRLHNATAKLMGIEISTKKQWDENWGKEWSDLIKGIWPSVSVDEFKKTFLESKDFKTLKLPTVPYAHRTLHFLKNSSYFLGLITSRERESTIRTCKNIGVKLNFFNFVQCLEDFPVIKPNPKVFESLIAECKKRNIEKEEIIYVGDVFGDYYASRDAGLQFAAVLTGGKKPEEFIKAGLNKSFIVDSIKDIPLLLQK